MREILFRGKRIDNGELVDGYYVETLRYNNLHWIWDGKEYIAVDSDTVGQYTGLKDKNGKKIFEGDIVTFKTRTSSFKPGYVRWYEEEVRFLVTMPDGLHSYPMDRSWEYEVLGNIHDNPELLKGGVVMGDLISRKALLEKKMCADICDAYGNFYSSGEFVLADDIENAPAVDAVELPCKVGDAVYRIDNGNFYSGWKPFVKEMTVTEISWKFDRSGKDLCFALIADGSRYKFSSIGKSVFLSKEDAEKALGERKENV